MLHRLRHSLLASLFLATACSEAPPPQAVVAEACPQPAALAQQQPDAAAAASGGQPAALPSAPRVLTRCVSGDSPLVTRTLEELEKRALAAETAGNAEQMLACADEALRIAEDDGVAAHLRAEALAHLGRLDEAAEGFTLALALAPNDPWVLAGAAELYANRLPLRRDRTLAGLAFAERGLAHVPGDATDLQVRLHLLAAWAQSDLGNQREALVHAGVALHLAPTDRDARVVRGRALYELTRFPEAARVLEKAVAADPGDAEAHHLLGLALERIEGRLDEAEVHFARATALDPEGFPPPVPLETAALSELVHAEVAALPERERGLLHRARVPVRVEALPSVEDLRAEDPPLSPTAVGMFRGPPLGLPADEPREILLFTRNLRRAARTMAELREQVRITLLHEVGHLAGEDEAALRARGLE